MAEPTQLAFDLKAGPTISSLIDIGVPIRMDLQVQPAIQADLAINPRRGQP